MALEGEQRENTLADLKSAMRDVRSHAKEARVLAAELSDALHKLEGMVPDPELVGNAGGDILARVRIRLSSAATMIDDGRSAARSLNTLTTGVYHDLFNAITYLQSLMEDTSNDVAS